MRERERANGAERYEGNENKEGKRNFVAATSESERREENERERERSEERSEKASDRRIEKGRRAKDAEELEGWISRRGTKSHEAEF